MLSRLKAGALGLYTEEPLLNRKKHRRESRNVYNQKLKAESWDAEEPLQWESDDREEFDHESAAEEDISDNMFLKK